MKRIKALAMVIAGLLAVAACSSPAVTGIKVHIQGGEYQEAIHLADSVLAGAEAGNAEVWYWRGRACSMIRDWTGAAESFEQAYSIDPSIAENLGNYWPAFYNTAAEYLQNGRREDALRMLQTGKNIIPERPEFDQLLGDIALGEHEYESALASFSSSIDLSLALMDVLSNTISQSQDPGVIEQLENEYDRMIQGVVIASFNSGAILKNFYINAEDETAAEGYFQQAVGVYGKALEIDPSSADLMTGLAEFYILHDLYDEALGIYDNALVAIDTGVADGWLSEEDAADMRATVMLTRGFTFIELERYDEGIAALEECRAELGDTYQVLAMIGHAHFVMGNYEESLDVMLRVTGKDGLENEEYGRAWYMIYAGYIRLERDRDALEAIQKAISFDGENADYHEYLAQTFSTLGRNREAMEAMNRAQQLRQ